MIKLISVGGRELSGRKNRPGVSLVTVEIFGKRIVLARRSGRIQHITDSERQPRDEDKNGKAPRRQFLLQCQKYSDKRYPAYDAGSNCLRHDAVPLDGIQRFDDEKKQRRQKKNRRIQRNFTQAGKAVFMGGRSRQRKGVTCLHL